MRTDPSNTDAVWGQTVLSGVGAVEFGRAGRTGFSEGAAGDQPAISTVAVEGLAFFVRNRDETGV